MRLIVLMLLSFVGCQILAAQDDSNTRVVSTIDSSYAGEIVLIQEFEVHVPIDAAWNVYATKKGWESAFTPLAEVDFRIGGTIQTSYNKDATIGDSTTIVLNIINYVPRKMLTLQAEISDHFPDFMKEDEKNFYNVIYFESIGPELTKIVSYGIGYRNNPKYHSLLNFFIQGNEMSYMNMISYLETGIPAKH